MSIKFATAALFGCIGLAACASTGPGSATANGPGQAPSGVTAANGGGQRQLGDIPSVGITNGHAATLTAVPNSKGASY